MPWVTINGNRYYRRSRRVGNRVLTEHGGAGHLAALEAKLDTDLRAARRMADGMDRERAELLGTDFGTVLAVDRLLAGLVAAGAAAAGFYTHRRQWRRRRGADMGRKTGMPAIDARLGRLQPPKRVPPRLAPCQDAFPEADRQTLQRAAAGDAAALAAAEKYLADPGFVNRWGSPVAAARAWLVGQIAGEDDLVAQAVYRKVTAVGHDLGWEAAGPLERMAVVRVLHNWLSVYLLEGKAGRLAVGGRERLAAERCLTLADRRFQQSVRALAFLRGEPAARLVTRIAEAEPAGESSSPSEARS